MQKVVSTFPQTKLGSMKSFVSRKQFGYFQTTLMFAEFSECEHETP